jgi:hypothetical protein
LTVTDAAATATGNAGSFVLHDAVVVRSGVDSTNSGTLYVHINDAEGAAR